MLRVKYNGRRFPRIVNLSGRQGTLSFTEDNKELLIPNYDTNLLMTFNTRLNVGVWEFDVIEVVKDTPKIEPPKEEVKPDPIKEEIKPKIVEKIKEVELNQSIKKPAKRGRPKGGRNG